LASINTLARTNTPLYYGIRKLRSHIFTVQAPCLKNTKLGWKRLTVAKSYHRKNFIVQATVTN